MPLREECTYRSIQYEGISFLNCEMCVVLLCVHRCQQQMVRRQIDPQQ